MLQPVVSNGVVYAVDFFDHTLHAIDAGTGKTIWVGAPTAPIEGGVRFNGAVVDGGMVYMEAGSYLYAFAVGCRTHGETCSPAWATDKLDVFVGKPVVADGMVFVGTALMGQIGHLLAFTAGCRTDGGACAPVLKVSIHGELTVEPISVADGRGFVVSNLANLVAAVPESCGSGTENSSPLWQDANVIQPIAATTVPGLVFVNTGAVELRAYPADCADPCEPLWTADTHGAVSPPVIVDGSRTWPQQAALCTRSVRDSPVKVQEARVIRRPSSIWPWSRSTRSPSSSGQRAVEVLDPTDRRPSDPRTTVQGVKLSRHARYRLRWIQRGHPAVTVRRLIDALPEVERSDTMTAVTDGCGSRSVPSKSWSTIRRDSWSRCG